MLLTKLISGSVIATAIILSILFLKSAWLIMVTALSLIGTWELARMLNQRGHRVSFWAPAIANLGLLMGVYLLVESDYSTLVSNWTLGHAEVLSFLNMYMAFACLALIVRTVFLRPRATVTELFAPVFQLTYLGWFPCYFILVRSLPGGEFYLVWALTSVAFSDIGAYFAGKFLGKHPYFQHLSPNKTIEGALGGVAASVGIAYVLSLAFGKWLPISPLNLVILATGMACLGQIGDLIESMIKRDMEVKDSGTWLPGFGGLLDRIDSYLLLAPFLYYYLTNFVIYS